MPLFLLSRSVSGSSSAGWVAFGILLALAALAVAAALYFKKQGKCIFIVSVDRLQTLIIIFFMFQLSPNWKVAKLKVG